MISNNFFLFARLSAEPPQIRMAPVMAGGGSLGGGGGGEPEEESEEYCLSWNGYNEQLSIVFRELCKVRTAFGGLSFLLPLTSCAGATFHGRDLGHRERLVQGAQAHLVGMQPLLQEDLHPKPLQTPNHLSQGRLFLFLCVSPSELYWQTSSPLSKLLKCCFSASSCARQEISAKKYCSFFELFIRGSISAEILRRLRLTFRISSS